MHSSSRVTFYFYIISRDFIF